MSMTLNILRWLAFPAAVIALMVAGLIASILLLNTFEDSWIAIPALSLGTCVAVYSGSRIAPSRRRLAILLASILILGASLFLLSLTAEGDREAQALALGGVAGAVAGALLALRRARATVQPLRSTSNRPLRYKGTAPYQYDP